MPNHNKFRNKPRLIIIKYLQSPDYQLSHLLRIRRLTPLPTAPLSLRIRRRTPLLFRFLRRPPAIPTAPLPPMPLLVVRLNFCEMDQAVRSNFCDDLALV